MGTQMSNGGHLSHEEYTERQVQRLLTTAKAVHNATLGIVLGSREIARLVRALDLQDEQVARPFIAVDSETDHLPVGPERAHWSAEALAEKDTEIAEYESEARERILAAADDLVRWLKSRYEKGNE